MSQRRVSALSSLAKSMNRFFGPAQTKQRRRKQTRLRLLEQLESRQLLALDIIGISPADGAFDVAPDTDLVITFNENVLRGQGNIHVVDSATGKLGVAIDVTSSNVVIDGAVVTIDLPQDLSLQTDFTVFIDPGTFIDTSGTTTADATLLTEGFEFLPLGPAVWETVGDGTDFTLSPPINWSVDNSNMPTTEAYGVPEWDGWSFADKSFWIAADNQARDNFLLGQGTLAIADSDEFDDRGPRQGPFDSSLISKPIFLDGVAADSVNISFDSSFRPEGSQIGTLDVRFDGGEWQRLLTLTDQDRRNVRESFDIANPSSGTMEFQWRKIGTNNWWWAFDNLLITGDVGGVPFGGISDATAWNFTNKRELTLSVDPGSMPENGGSAIGTVTRNITQGDLVVTLTSSDTTEATVPETVTILDGQASATFPITAVDDDEIDGTQIVTIMASSETYLSGAATISVTDDDAFAIISLTPADNEQDFPFSNNLEITFNKDVKAGSGRIYVVQSSTNTLGFTVDVNSAAVTFSGPTVTINPPGNLLPSTEYYVLIDNGAILDTTTDLFGNTTMLLETFDLLPLGPFVTATGGDGTDFTKAPPLGFSIPVNPPGGLLEWRGWSFADKNSWLAATGDGGRAAFTLGQGNVAVADPDAWNHPSDTQTYTTVLRTAGVDLSKITAGSATLQFDSSFRGTNLMTGEVWVSYNDGGTWTRIASTNLGTTATNSTILLNNTATGTTGGFVRRAGLVNPASGTMRFEFRVPNAGNVSSGWWAIDNVRVAGQVTGRPWEGLADPSQWNFRSSELPTLRIAIDPSVISEAGGVATATLSRSVFNVGDLVVTLTSSDTTEATVPATVTIPDGQFTTTFDITAINDEVLDGDQLVTITATAAGLLNIPSTIIVKSVDQPVGITLDPADDSTDVPVSSDFSITLDQNVKKGNGFIHFVRASDNKLGASVDVKSSDVTITDATVTVNPPANLDALTDYYVVIDDGAILAATDEVRFNAVLLTEDFEKLPLGPAVWEVPLNSDGNDWTATPPEGFSVDNSQMPPGGVPEWTGWTFANKDFWANAGGQGRVNFTRGSGTIAVGDTDEWEDTQRPSNLFNSLFMTPSIDLTNVAADSVRLEFDSSFRPENPARDNNQEGRIEVSYDDGANWESLLILDRTNTSHLLDAPNIDERLVIEIDNPATGSMMVRWGVTGTNDYWWAIDNVEITGHVSGLPFDGISDPTTWSITTADTDTLSVSLDMTSISENGGAATGTVSRNLGTTGDVVVTLTNTDPARVTMPATVTILDGQASATFAVTAVDNDLFGGNRVLEISASADDFVGSSTSFTITDDESGDVIITEIMYDPDGPEPRNEWIELYNRGTTDADLGGWTLNDEDVFGVLQWGAIPAGTMLPAGGFALLYNGWFGLTTEADFRSEWSVPAEALVIGIPWSELANNPSPENEILALQDQSGADLNTVNYDDDGTIWPAAQNGTSIFLLNPTTADNTVGQNWNRSVAGAGSVSATGPIYSTANAGSPGYFDTIPPDAPVITLVSDTGASAEDLITNNGGYNVAAEPGGVIEYRLNGGDWVTTKPDAIEGENLIEARQTDPAGNLGAVGSLTFTLDVTAPDMPTIVLAEDTGIDDDFITSIGDYTVTPAESGGLVEFRLNGGDWLIEPPTAIEGENLIEARQTDIAGNVSDLGSLAFVLDTIAPVAPVVTLDVDTGIDGDGITSEGAYTTVPAEEGGTVEYRVNGGDWMMEPPAAVEGSNLIEVRQTDTAGNVSEIGSLTFVLDTIAPEAPVVTLDTDTGIDGDGITSEGAYTSTPAEEGGTVEYRLNGGEWMMSPPAAVEGSNLIEVRQTDTAGNVSEVGALTFVLDTIAPEAPAVTLDNDNGIAGDFLTNDGSYTVTPAEAGGTVEYRLNESGEWSTTAPTAVEGTNFIEARQIDTAGNVGAIGSLTFTLDSVAPVVTNVYATSTTWAPQFISATASGIGIELTAGMLPLPWSNVDTLVVQFSEDILNASSSTLEVRNSLGVIPATVTYDAGTFQAVIQLPSMLSFAKIRVAVSDAVEDLAGSPLGGGNYDLRFDILGADADGNGRVNGQDLTPFGAAFNSQPGQATYNARVNWNGDARVNGQDLAVFSANFNLNLSNLGEPGAAFGGGGGGGGSGVGGFRNFGSLADDLFGKLGEEDEEKEGFFGI